MSKYGEYNFKDDVLFKSNYENNYSELPETEDIQLSFNEMYFNNGIEIPSKLQVKLANEAVKWANFSFSEEFDETLITVSNNTWNEDSIEGKEFEGANDCTGVFSVQITNKNSENKIECTVTIGGETKTEEILGNGSKTFDFSDLDFTNKVKYKNSKQVINVTYDVKVVNE